MKITIVGCGDWEGLYIDGQIEIQNHTVDIRQMAEILANSNDDIEKEIIWVSDEEVEKMGGHLPRQWPPEGQWTQN